MSPFVRTHLVQPLLLLPQRLILQSNRRELVLPTCSFGRFEFVEHVVGRFGGVSEGFVRSTGGWRIDWTGEIRGGTDLKSVGRRKGAGGFGPGGRISFLRSFVGVSL